MRVVSPRGALRNSRLAALIIIVLSCVVARSQTPPPVAPSSPPSKTNPCETQPGQSKGLTYYAKCGKHLYDKVTAKEGFRLVVGSVAPGGGLAAGVGYGHRTFGPTWQTEFNSSARISTRRYWEIDGNLRLTKTSASTTASPDVGNLKSNIYGFVKDMRRLNFFGLGPESSEDDRAVFHYREAVVGADISQPINRWLDLGGAVEGIWPELIEIEDPTVTSVERKFTEATAPGLNSQPGYLHLAAFAKLHSRGQPESRKLEYLFLYHIYHDVGDQLYSFRRFNADLRHKFPFGEKNEFRVRARLSLAETREDQQVPFYLMETLGGQNIRRDDTLRGFRDYRFRDRNHFLVQNEFLRNLYGPLDLITFWDLGKVASSVSRFDEGRVRHNFGVGVVVKPRRLDNYLFRFYLAFGSGEGSRTRFSAGVSGRGNRLTR
jgi:hypothetical protein